MAAAPRAVPPVAESAALLGAAVDVALRRGVLRDPEAVNAGHSHLAPNSFSLQDADGQPLARLPLAAVRRQDARRRGRLARLLGISHPGASLPSQWRVLLRTRSAEERALAWALSTARAVPEPGFSRRRLAIAALLLLLGVLPGLAYLVLLAVEQGRYRQRLVRLEVLWKALGRPDPDEHAVARLATP